MQELYLEIELSMKQAVDHLHRELKQVRTGRASLTILDSVHVDYYDTPTPLNQLATLSVPEASLIMIQPFDPSQISAIEKAIMRANLGLNPSNDGRLIRLPVPPLTEERRKDFARRAHEMAENARNSIRQARREGNDRLKGMEKEKEISEDDERRGNDEMQKLHDHYIGQVGETLDRKEKDIMTV